MMFLAWDKYIFDLTLFDKALRSYIHLFVYMLPKRLDQIRWNFLSLFIGKKIDFFLQKNGIFF